ncbi:MAG: cytochrome P450 [Dermatophilaceae bacterium]
MMIEFARDASENRRLVDVDDSHWYDRLLTRVPLRTAELACPPADSGLKPVRGDRGLPLLGLGLHTVLYGPAFQIQLLRRHGPVSWWQAFGRSVVAVSGPDAVQEVLIDRGKAFVSGWPALIGPWFDGGLLALDGKRHLHDRRHSQPAYGNAEVDHYIATMAEDAEHYLDGWPVGRSFQAVPALRRLSGQLTTRAFLGEPYDQLGHQVMRDVEDCIRGETALVRLPLPGTSWRRAHRARARLASTLRTALPAARDRAGQDFLSVFARIGSGLTEREVIDHMIFTLIASHDTTTSAMIAAFYFLGKHPDWQERARAEAVAPGPPDPRSRHALDLVVKESIRLVPPSPIALRTTTKDTAVQGRFIPAGQLVSVCTGVNQLIDDLWPRPEQFDPDRFAPHRREDRAHRMAWVPFGGGVHKCIGMQFGMLKVVATLDALLRRYAWSFPDSYEAPWRFTSLPAPTDGLPVVLRPVGDR